VSVRTEGIGDVDQDLVDAGAITRGLLLFRKVDLAILREQLRQTDTDRAQGLLNDLTLVSNETLFDGFGVARLW
jgi:hypothetical protein